MRILKDDTLAVIIDVQERLLPHISNHETLIENMKILISGLKVLDVPLLMCEQYKKGLGPTLGEISDMLHVEAIEKTSFSACDESSFCEAAKELNRKTVIVAGIESHVCVQQTVIDLIELGYRPVLIEDCVSSRKENDKKVAIERMRQEGAIITTYESILFELCRFSGNETFKAISKLVK